MTDEPTAARRPPRQRLLDAFISYDSYGSVLALIVLTYVLSIALSTERQRSAILAVQMAVVWIALHVSGARKVVRAVAAVALVLTAIVAALNAIWGDPDQLLGVLFLTASLLYLIAPISIVRAISRRPEVDREVVLGAVDAYLLVGLFFAFLYQSIGAIEAGAFFGTQGDGSLPNYLFFSFTTLTTTGYGNLVPAANPGQSLAVLEMLTGQLFLVTAVAKVISAWQPPAWRGRQAEDRSSSAQGGAGSSTGQKTSALDGR